MGAVADSGAEADSDAAGSIDLSAAEADSEGSDDGMRFDLGDSDIPTGVDGSDPVTCAQAAKHRTYVGCEFWPTVTFNPVLENFDFAAAVANASAKPAEVVVERNGREILRATVQPGSLEKLILPWVAELKGLQFNAQTTGARPKASAFVGAGAYRLSSSVPVTVWQFNPLQYTDSVENCALQQDIDIPGACLSVSNDASLLIPTPAMRGSYRVMLPSGAKGTEGGFDDTPGSVAITATVDDTRVRLRLPAGVESAAGPGVPAIVAGGEGVFTLDAGDVVQVMAKSGSWWGEAHHDLSGALVSADQPVQVIAAVALTSVPSPEVAGVGPDGGDVRVGLQVMGYGHATGYMYPGGLNLDLISDPPAI